MLAVGFDTASAAPLEPVPVRSRHEHTAVVRADEQSEEAVELARIWERLTRGRLEIVDDFVTLDRCYLVVRPREGHELKKPARRGLMVLERVLVEGCQKVVAMELGVAPSTVAGLGRAGLLAIGLGCRMQNTPYIVAVAALAAHEKTSALARVSQLTGSEGGVQVLSIPRPDACAHHKLSRAVLEVTASLLEGKSRSIIARTRKRSERTIANQLSTAFRELNASSRLDVVRVLARAQAVAVPQRS